LRLHSALSNIRSAYWLKFLPECSFKRLFSFLLGFRTPHDSRAFEWMARS